MGGGGGESEGNSLVLLFILRQSTLWNDPVNITKSLPVLSYKGFGSQLSESRESQKQIFRLVKTLFLNSYSQKQREGGNVCMNIWDLLSLLYFLLECCIILFIISESTQAPTL